MLFRRIQNEIKLLSESDLTLKKAIDTAMETEVRDAIKLQQQHITDLAYNWQETAFC